MIVSDFIDAICETIEVEDTAACTPPKKLTHGYENGKIYMIIEKHTKKLVYIGCTIQLLKARWKGHKSFFRRFPDAKYSTYIMNNGGPENHEIVLVETYPCNNKQELINKETEYISCLKPQCNILQRRDEEVASEDTDRPEFVCSKCGKVFFSKRNLTNHLNRQYPCNVGKYQCDKCRQRFNKSSNFSQHRKTCSGHKTTFAQKNQEYEQMRECFAKSVCGSSSCREDEAVEENENENEDDKVLQRESGNDIQFTENHEEAKEMVNNNVLVSISESQYRSEMFKLDQKQLEIELQKINLQKAWLIYQKSRSSCDA